MSGDSPPYFSELSGCSIATGDGGSLTFAYWMIFAVDPNFLAGTYYNSSSSEEDSILVAELGILGSGSGIALFYISINSLTSFAF